MKQSLRNLLLVGAALVSTAALAQEAPFTVTQKWSQKIDCTGNPYRSGTGVNGKVYGFNKGTGEITEFSAEGVKTLTTVSGCNAITSDDAGNIIMKKGGFGSAADTNTKYLVIPADGSANVDVEITTEADMTGRQDLLGRAVGNVMSEPGGAFFVEANGKQGALPIVIINGAAADEFSEYAPDKLAGLEKAVASTMSYAVPVTNNVEDLLALDPIYQLGYYYRSDSEYEIRQYDADADKWNVAFTRPNVKNSHGWDVFELGGELYQVVTGVGANWSTNWCIADSKGNVLYTYTYEGVTFSNANGGTMVARVIDDKTVQIYQFGPVGGTTVFAGMWEVALPADPDPAPLYATGGFAGWDPKSPSVFDFKDGAYTLDVDASDLTDFKFKISTVMATDADADAWVAFNSGAIGVTDYGTDYTLQLDQQVTLEKGKEGNFQFPGKGTYTITVSADLSTLILSGIQAEPDQFDHPEKLYLRGASTNWGIDENYVMNLTTERGMNGEYVYETGNIALDGEFKVCVDADWNKGNWGRQDYQGNDGCLAATIGGTYGAWENCDNFKTAAAIEKCAVKFYYGGAGRQCYIQINATSGAEIIEAVDNSEATYYNLQGVKVAADKLNGGIYIRVANGKASKVLVK